MTSTQYQFNVRVTVRNINDTLVNQGIGQAIPGLESLPPAALAQINDGFSQAFQGAGAGGAQGMVQAQLMAVLQQLAKLISQMSQGGGQLPGGQLPGGQYPGGQLPIGQGAPVFNPMATGGGPVVKVQADQPYSVPARPNIPTFDMGNPYGGTVPQYGQPWQPYFPPQLANQPIGPQVGAQAFPGGFNPLQLNLQPNYGIPNTPINQMTSAPVDPQLEALLQALSHGGTFEDKVSGMMMLFVKRQQQRLEKNMNELRQESEAASAAGPNSPLANQGESRNIRFEQLKNEMQKLSSIQQAMSAVLNVFKEQADKTIGAIR